MIDTETTDLHGAICELAVVDECGRVVLNTLVNPQCPIAVGATEVHGISAADVAGAPTLAQVWPQLVEVTRGRTILAYNAPYDRDVLLADARRHGLELADLDHAGKWGCLMRAESRFHDRPWRRLDAGHRALGDAEAARQVLVELAGRR